MGQEEQSGVEAGAALCVPTFQLTSLLACSHALGHSHMRDTHMGLQQSLRLFRVVFPE